MHARITATLLIVCLAASARAEEVKLENDYATWLISPTGYNLSLIDKPSGTQRCALPGKRPFCTLRKGGVTHSPSACKLAGGRMTFSFDKAAAGVVIKVDCKKHYFVFEVESIQGEGVEGVTMGNLAVTCGEYVSGMSGVTADDQFAAAARSLNLQAMSTVGGRPVTLSCGGTPTYGIVGLKMALIACPADRMRDLLKEMLVAEGQPHSALGGPFALDAQENRGSYTFAGVSETNVDEWIALAKRAGLRAIHFNGWAHSLGHYQPREALYPNGMAGLKAVVDKIHAAGLTVGMHTLTGCIAPHDPWVRPVPDPRLAKDASFTLSAAIDEKQDTLPCLEKARRVRYRLGLRRPG